MKSLYNYILESHGVIDGVNSWDKTVDFICKNNRKTVTEPEFLAPWMRSVKLTGKESMTTEKYYAAYRDSESTLVDGKMNVVIEIDGNLQKSGMALQHEFQHAFDDWVARTKGKAYLSDKYQIGTGGEFEETSPYNVLNPKTSNCDDMFALLKYCTYFFETSEVNAYSREFDKWLDDQKVIDLKQLVQAPHDDIGINPLTIVNLLTFVLDSENQYVVDADHMDWDYIAQIISSPKPGTNKSWTQMVLGRKYSESEGKIVVRKVLMDLYKRGMKQVFSKYRKILEYHIYEKGLKVTKWPYWWNV